VGSGNPECFGINTNSSEIRRCCSILDQGQLEDDCFAEWSQGAKPATFDETGGGEDPLSQRMYRTVSLVHNNLLYINITYHNAWQRNATFVLFKAQDVYWSKNIFN
jgi:hypothetical protein